MRACKACSYAGFAFLAVIWRQAPLDWPPAAQAGDPTVLSWSQKKIHLQLLEATLLVPVTKRTTGFSGYEDAGGEIWPLSALTAHSIRDWAFRAQPPLTPVSQVNAAQPYALALRLTLLKIIFFFKLVGRKSSHSIVGLMGCGL